MNPDYEAMVQEPYDRQKIREVMIINPGRIGTNINILPPEYEPGIPGRFQPGTGSHP